MAVLRFAVAVALRLGRSLSLLLVPPVCLAFALGCADARAASRAYLARVLGRPARPTEVLRHFITFGTTVLDRIYFLNDENHRFEITVTGEEVVNGILAQGGGCLLLGAHHGSFEVLRSVGRSQPDLRVAIAMFEATGRKISAALNAINPRAVPHLISLGTPGAMIEMRECLERGDFVGMLADRTLPGDSTRSVAFLGAPAAFPGGPARLAGLLHVPVVMMIGLYRGGNRYEVQFERLATPASANEADIVALIENYVARLEQHCRSAPFNWFNFFDFWA